MKIDNQKEILITGGTGLVGSLLALRALEESRRVSLLVRPKVGKSVEDRVKCLLFKRVGLTEENWYGFKRNLRIIEGDITQKDLGISPTVFKDIQDRTGCVFHSAAFTCFRQSDYDKAAKINIQGTANVAEFCKNSGSPLMAISTAYIAGQTNSNILETPELPVTSWRNVYEETKYQAEQNIHTYCSKHSIPYTVFRPSILSGASDTGFTLRFDTVYTFLNLFHNWSRRCPGKRIRINGDPKATLNLIPVDYAIRAIWKLSQLSRKSGMVFHITNPHAPSLGELAGILERLFDLRIIVDTDMPQPLTHQESDGQAVGVSANNISERLVKMSSYQPYLGDKSTFDLRNTSAGIPDFVSDFPTLDMAYFKTILNYACQHRWGRSMSPKKHTDLLGADSSAYSHYFTHHLKTMVGRRLIENLRSLTVITGVHIVDGRAPSPWVLTIKDGILLDISANSVNPECTFLLPATIFEEIILGRLNPQQAFFEGHVEIEGDMEKGLQTATALAEFFKKFPYLPSSQERNSLTLKSD